MTAAYTLHFEWISGRFLVTFYLETAMSDVLMLEPNAATRAVVQQAIEGVRLRSIASGSWDDALLQAARNSIGVFVADWQILVADIDLRDELHLTNRFRSVLSQLRAAHEASAPLRVVLTAGASSAESYEAAHAAAIIAGVDAFLGPEDLRLSTILESYLARLLSERADLAVPTARRAEPAVVRPAAAAPSHPSREAATHSRAAHVVDAFDLQTSHLRSDDSGRWDAKKIATALGVGLTPFAAALGSKYTTVHKTPDAPSLQEALAPFGNVLAMLEQIYSGDRRSILTWLQQEQRQLGGKAPIKSLLTAGEAPLVEQWLAGLWLGEPA